MKLHFRIRHLQYENNPNEDTSWQTAIDLADVYVDAVCAGRCATTSHLHSERPLLNVRHCCALLWSAQLKKLSLIDVLHVTPVRAPSS